MPQLRSRLRSVRPVSPWVHFPSELRPSVLDDIVDAGEAAGLGKALLSDGEVNSLHRAGEVAWLSGPTHTWLSSLVRVLLEKANEVWRLEWDDIEPLQFTVYEPGHFYGWHWDQQLSTDLQGRKFALSLQLSSPDSYDGGDLQIIAQDGQVVTLDGPARQRGQVIAFPSYILHQVTPVTRGVRLSLVAWARGPRLR